MKNLVIFESKRFWNRKNCCIFLISLLLCLVLFYGKFDSDYKNFKDDYLLTLEDQNTTIAIWKDFYSYEIGINTDLSLSAAKAKNISDLKVSENPEAEYDQKIYDLWDSYAQMNLMIQYYLEQDSLDEDGIRQNIRYQDEKLAGLSYADDMVISSGLYRDTYEDFEKRMTLHQAYDEAGIKEPICSYVPTGTFCVSEVLSGENYFIFAIILIMILLNFEIWPAEFSNNTYAGLYTLPYSKNTIIFLRMLVRAFYSILVYGINMLFLFLLGSLNYGTGLENFVVSGDGDAFKAITAWDALNGSISYGLVLCIAFVCVTLFISYAVKDDLNSLIILAVYLLYAMTNLYSSNFVTAIFKVQAFVEKSNVVSMSTSIIALTIAMVISAVGMTFIGNWRED